MTVSIYSWFSEKRKIVDKHYFLKRLNIRFFIGVGKKIFWELKNKNQPWLTANSVELIKSWVRLDDVFLEFGSGQSTKWFADRIKSVTSVEHNYKWYQKTKKDNQNRINPINLVLGTNRKDYLKILGDFPNNSIDICLIDGEWRRDCLLGVVKKIKVGGMIILDNAETYMPKLWSSRSFQDGWEERGSPEKNKISKIVKELKKWRIISTTDVSQDTVFFIKKYE